MNGDYNDFVNNTVRITSPTSSVAAWYMAGSGTGKKVINNIMYNAGTGYAYNLNDSAVFGLITSDHNDLFKIGRASCRERV